MNEAPLTTPTDQPLPLFYANRDRFRHWQSKRERFISAQGVRAMLGHVSEERWITHYAANEDIFEAVLSELERIDC